MNDNSLPTTPIEYQAPTIPPSSGRIVFSYAEIAIAEIADRNGCEAQIMTAAELAMTS